MKCLAISLVIAMVKFWTVLLLTYHAGTDDQEPMISSIVLPSMEICGAVMDDFYPTIFAHYPDSMAQCLETAEKSTTMTSPLPKLRPF